MKTKNPKTRPQHKPTPQFKLGIKAYHTGQSTADNPWSKGTEQATEWQQGYDHAAQPPLPKETP